VPQCSLLWSDGPTSNSTTPFTERSAQSLRAILLWDSKTVDKPFADSDHDGGAHRGRERPFQAEALFVDSWRCAGKDIIEQNGMPSSMSITCGT